jgi:inner membrane protein
VAALYALLYLLLGSEDYALLFGSATLFAVLSGVMFLTRDLRPGGASGEAAPGQ